MYEKPEFLYHYTTVESLALILKNRTIKFNPLTVLDDSQEEQIEDNTKYCKYVFISSWTSEKEESIPMWNMYASMESGIRIKLPIYPFKNYMADNKENDLVEDKSLSTLIPIKQQINDSYYLTSYAQSNILHKINYTNNITKLVPKISEIKDNKISINLGKLGKHKNISWEFQKEWRYILIFSPMGLKEMQKNTEQLGNALHQRFNDIKYSLPFNYFFLPINTTAFNLMEITLSPKISDGNKIFVNLLKKEYNSKMIIHESELSSKIR